MKICFTKMQGLGNDFIVLDAVRQNFVPTPAQARWLADRHFGIGCDQILVVEAPTRPGVDFRYRIFNADGSEVEQCGNGARCFVRFVRDHGLTEKHEMRVETRAGIITLRLEEDGCVTVDMGVPHLSPEDVPFASDRTDIVQPLQVHDKTFDITAVSMGNPHAVQVVVDVDDFPVGRYGPLIEAHERFPRRVNAGFMEIVDRHNIRLRVYERGTGETLACGTGACAAVVAGVLRGLLDAPVCVATRGGVLSVAWAGPNQPVLMSGPAETVFEGEAYLPAEYL
jgi:diaminopimelate epimerase